MINPNTEQLVTLARAKIPGNPAIATRWRWAGKGARGVKLETLIIGGQRYTSVEAVARFIAALNESGTVPDPGIPAADAANAKLLALGA